MFRPLTDYTVSPIADALQVEKWQLYLFEWVKWVDWAPTSEIIDAVIITECEKIDGWSYISSWGEAEEKAASKTGKGNHFNMALFDWEYTCTYDR